MQKTVHVGSIVTNIVFWPLMKISHHKIKSQKAHRQEELFIDGDRSSKISFSIANISSLSQEITPPSYMRVESSAKATIFMVNK